MRLILAALAVAALLSLSGAFAAHADAASMAMVPASADAPVALMTGLLAIGFLIAHRAMDDDD